MRRTSNAKPLAAPRRIDKIFRLRRNVLMTPSEQRAAANGKAVFTPAELRTLYAHANEQQRLYLLLGLNCAFTQKDIATLAADDLVLGVAPVIDRIRHKTRGAAIRGRWGLWQETANLLKARMATTPKNPDGLALLTSEGRPVVDDANDSDSVALTWARLFKSLDRRRLAGEDIPPVRRLPFKTLRKTASDTILRLSGSEAVQQLMLAHSSGSIARKHYTGETDFTPLVEPLRQFGEQLKAARLFTPDPAEADTGTQK